MKDFFLFLFLDCFFLGGERVKFGSSQHRDEKSNDG